MPISAQTHTKLDGFVEASLADGTRLHRGPLFASLAMMTEGLVPSQEQPDLRSFIMPGRWDAPVVGPAEWRFQSPEEESWIVDKGDVSRTGHGEKDQDATVKALTLPKGWALVPQEGDGPILSFCFSGGKGTYRSSPTWMASGLYERNDLYKIPGDATDRPDAWDDAVKHIKSYDERLGRRNEFYLVVNGSDKSCTVFHRRGAMTEMTVMDLDTAVHWAQCVRSLHKDSLNVNFNFCDISEQDPVWETLRRDPGTSLTATPAWKNHTVPGGN